MSICKFIRFYENVVWDYLSDVYSFPLKAAELGFTNDLIYRIASFYRYAPTGVCEVYAIQAASEDIRGADIDLFIYNGTDYSHFMLQAKIMSSSARYLDISRHGPRAQFIKLIKAAKQESAFPLYLLFNGKTTQSSGCKPDHGCAIVWADLIRALRWSHRKKFGSKPTPRLSYADVSASLLPLHYLFCPGSLNAFKLPPGKQWAEIYRGFPLVNVSQGESNVLDLETDQRNTSGHANKPGGFE